MYKYSKKIQIKTFFYRISMIAIEVGSFERKKSLLSLHRFNMFRSPCRDNDWKNSRQEK
jgi:hypothetical protein